MKRLLALSLTSVLLASTVLTAVRAEETAAAAEENTAAEEAEAEEVLPEMNEALYESDEGWSVRYDADVIEVNEGEGITGFVYTGESAGTNMAAISVIEDRMPEDVLAEVKEGWGKADAEIREGYYLGRTDVWSCSTSYDPEEEGKGLCGSATAIEYNGGTLLIEATNHLSGDDALDIPMSDAIAGIYDTLDLGRYVKQAAYAGACGTYSSIVMEEIDGEDASAEHSIVLNGDHTGVLSLQDTVDILWYSDRIVYADDPDTAYAYRIDGDVLTLVTDGIEQRFTKKVSGGSPVREQLGLEPEDSPEWVQALPQAEEAEQLFIVAEKNGTTAWVSMHEKDKAGTWKMILSTPGFIGRNGTCPDGEHEEGCGQTPVGVYHFNKAFGIADDPGCALPYIKVTDDYYWSGDQAEGMRYNELVRLSEYPDLDLENSEHIMDYTYQYQYCLNISFNEEGAPGRGSAIFLHCLGPWKPYTGGCVAIPMDEMRYVMQHVLPDCVVVIDALADLAPEEAGLPAAETYESADGWAVRYDPETISVNENGEAVEFVYTGECAGTCMLSVSTVADKQPEELLAEVTAEWTEDPTAIDRYEGFFPGTEDQWGYWRVLPADEEGSGMTRTAIAGEYNGGVLLFDFLTHMGSDEGMNAAMNDTLAEVMNSITYEEFAPQQMYGYVPGTYRTADGAEEESSLTLNADHTGMLVTKDGDADILWGSIELIAADGSFRYEYDVEGENLYIRIGSDWIELQKDDAADGE